MRNAFALLAAFAMLALLLWTPPASITWALELSPRAVPFIAALLTFGIVRADP